MKNEMNSKTTTTTGNSAVKTHFIINSSHIDAELLKKTFSIISDKLINDSQKPSFLTNASIELLQPPSSAPFITEINVRKEYNSRKLSFLYHFQGSASCSISSSASLGLFEISNLFSFSISVEVLLRLLVAHVEIEFDENNTEMCLRIGDDLIIDFEVKPLLGDKKDSTKHISSISAWISSFAQRELRGREINLAL